MMPFSSVIQKEEREESFVKLSLAKNLVVLCLFLCFFACDGDRYGESSFVG